MELLGLCDTRQPAVISGGAVVLGITCKKTFYQRIYFIHPRSVSYENRDPLALLMWIVGVVIYTGLPGYFRQASGQIPSFYRTIPRRKIILVGIILLDVNKAQTE